MIKIKNVERPNDWPCNNHEVLISRIHDSFVEFLKDKSTANKEALIQLISRGDINEIDHTGRVRFCKYEIYLINELFTNANCIRFMALKVFLYEHLKIILQYYRLLNMSFLRSSDNSEENLEELLPELRLFSVI